MINEIKINTVRLGTDAGKVEGYIKNIEDAMNNTEERVAAIDNMWDGSASKAFQKAMKSDIKELKAVIKSLKEVHKYETDAKKKYETCEGKVKELVDRIKV